MNDKEYYSLNKMLDYIEKVERYTFSLSFEEFSCNDIIVDATIFSLSQIGELVKNLSDSFQQQYCTIKWSVIKGLRNKIVHDYEGIKLNFIWDIITKDIKQLKANLEKILEDDND